MTEAWPSNVPYELASLDVKTPFRAPTVTDMEDGNFRARRSTSLNVALITGTILMSNAEFATFRAWVRDTLVDGTLRFTMSLPIDGAYVTRTCQFTQPYTASVSEYDKPITVSLALDVQDY